MFGFKSKSKVKVKAPELRLDTDPAELQRIVDKANINLARNQTDGTAYFHDTPSLVAIEVEEIDTEALDPKELEALLGVQLEHDLQKAREEENAARLELLQRRVK